MFFSVVGFILMTVLALYLIIAGGFGALSMWALSGRLGGAIPGLIMIILGIVVLVFSWISGPFGVTVS